MIDFEDEIRLAKRLLGQITQHDTDIQRLKKRVRMQEHQSMMITGSNEPAPPAVVVDPVDE